MKFTFADYKSVSDYCIMMKFTFADYKSVSDYCIMMKFTFADYKSVSDYCIMMKFTFADYKSVLDYADYGKKYRKVMKFIFADSKSVYWVNSVVTFLNRLQFNNGSSPPQFQLALTLFTRTLVPRSYDSKSMLAGRVFSQSPY
jgi:hypothetical protein